MTDSRVPGQADSTAAISEQARLLGHAADDGKLDVVKAIIAAHPGVIHARGGIMSSTPLHFASAQGRMEIARLLIEAGADTNAREGASNTTPIHWAAAHGHFEMVKLLVLHGADLQLADDWHNLGPVGWAAAVPPTPQLEIAEYLLSKGASLDIFSALALNRPQNVRALLQSGPACLQRRMNLLDDAWLPIHFATLRNLPEMVELLLECGADITSKTAWGLTPLCLALRSKSDRGGTMLKLLQKRGAVPDLSALLQQGELADAGAYLVSHPGILSSGGSDHLLLHFVAREGLADAAALLLRNGADPNAAGHRLIDSLLCAISPLHRSVFSGHQDVTRVLLQNGADPNLRGRQVGRLCYWDVTPLHVAALRGHVDAARLLVEFGADITARDRQGIGTPLDWAKAWGQDADPSKSVGQDAVASFLESPGSRTHRI